jgi:hypothetical protein
MSLAVRFEQGPFDLRGRRWRWLVVVAELVDVEEVNRGRGGRGGHRHEREN